MKIRSADLNLQTGRRTDGHSDVIKKTPPQFCDNFLQCVFLLPELYFWFPLGNL